MSTLKVSNISGFSGDDILMSSPSYLLVSGTLNITGTDSEFSIPAGTTGERPGTPSEGQIRYNTTTGYIEVYNDTDWVNIVNVTDTESTSGGSGGVEDDNDPAGASFIATEVVTAGLVGHMDFADPASFDDEDDTVARNLVSGSSLGNFNLDGTHYWSTKHGGVKMFDDGHGYWASNTHYNKMSYCMWIDQWDTQSDAYAIVFNRENCFELSSGDRNLKWAVRTSSTQWFWENTDCNMPLGQPMHIGLSYDGNYVRFYMNGLLAHVYHYNDNANLYSSSQYHKFNGRSDGATTRGSRGKFSLYNWRIYNRALTEAEFVQNYNATCSRFGHPQIPTDETALHHRTNLIFYFDSRYEACAPGGTETCMNLAYNSSNTNDMRGKMNNMSYEPIFERINGTDGGAVRAWRTNDTGQNRITIRNFPRPGTNRTYEIWIKPRLNIGWQTWMDDTNERILFGTPDTTIRIYPDINTGIGVDADTWQQIVYTLSGTSCVIYKNGAEVATGTYTSTLNSGTGELWLMGDGGSESTDMASAIFRVYNTALTAAQVNTNYQAEKDSFGLA